MTASGEDPSLTIHNQHARDAALMSRVAGGEAQAFRQLSELYLERLYRHAKRTLKSDSEAEDVTQEVMLRLWQAAPDWKPQAKVGTWLYRVTLNLCIDRIRKRRPESDQVDELAHDSIRPGQLLERRQVAEHVRSAIGDLPERQRHALELSHFDGLGNPDVAEVLGVSVEAVESLLSRARQKLKAALDGLQGAEQ